MSCTAANSTWVETSVSSCRCRSCEIVVRASATPCCLNYTHGVRHSVRERITFPQFDVAKVIHAQTQTCTPTQLCTHTQAPICMFRGKSWRRWLISKSSFSRQCVGRICDTCSQLTWKSHSPHTHRGTFWPTLTPVQSLYLQESCQNKPKSEVCIMVMSPFDICNTIQYNICLLKGWQNAAWVQKWEDKTMNINR